MLRHIFAHTLCLLMTVATFSAASDWPMAGHDPARSGWSPDEPRGPMSRAWYRSFHDEGISSTAQPVVAAGKLYLGTLRGVMYCLDARTGQESWSFRAGGAILHSAAIADGAVYFAALDGRLYALDAATGTQKWAFQTGAPLWNAPLPADVDGAKVFFGGRDGHVYALKAADGTLAWRADVGGPVLASLALADGRLFAAGEDMKAYCFSAADGKSLWTAPLHGVSCRGYYPVVAGKTVFFVTQPGLGRFGPADVLAEACTNVGLQPNRAVDWAESAAVRQAREAHNGPLLKDPGTLAAQLQEIRKLQQTRPHTRTLFAFDVASGAEPWVAPVVWAEGDGGTLSPPVVSADGQVWVKFGLLTWAQRASRIPHLQLGRLDLATGLPTPLGDAMEGSPAAQWTCDESTTVAGAGGTIFQTLPGLTVRRLIGIELASGEATTLGEVACDGDATVGPMNITRLLKGEQIPPGLELIPRGAGTYGGADAHASVIVADEMLFIVPRGEGSSGSILIAWRAGPAQADAATTAPGEAASSATRDVTYRQVANLAAIRNQPLDWDTLLAGAGRCWPGPTGPLGIEPEFAGRVEARARQADQYGRTLTDADLEKYIWELPSIATPTTAPKAIRDKLAQCIEELCSQEDWQPLRHPDMSSGGWYYLDDPTDMFTALAAAWPALDERMRGIVAIYLRDYYRRHNPLAEERLDHEVGVPRTTYDLPTYARLRTWHSRPPGIGRLHPLWAWANATGDWKQLRDDWAPRIRDLIFRLRPPADNAELLWQNDMLSGVIAYCRLARQFGDAASERQAVPVARALLRARIEAERTHTLTRFIQPQPNTPLPGRYLYLTPEIGRLLRDHALAEHTALYERCVSHHRPTWFLAWGPASYDAGSACVEHPVNPWAAFCARAMLFADEPVTLEKYLDIPWCKADLYYIHKLSLVSNQYPVPRVP